MHRRATCWQTVTDHFRSFTHQIVEWQSCECALAEKCYGLLLMCP